MRVLSTKFLTSLAFMSVAHLSATPMFQDLEFGDTQTRVLEKLDANPTFTTPAKTMFGRTGLNKRYKSKNKVQGLEFAVSFEWTTTEDSLLLSRLDLYSTIAERETLQLAYSKLALLFTEIYGPPKFNNGLPDVTQLENNEQTIAGALWLYDDNAVSLGLGKEDTGFNLVIQFMEKQPELIKTP